MKKVFLVTAILLCGTTLAQANTGSWQSKAREAGKAYDAGQYEQARNLLTQACDLGHANSCRNLGTMWESGLGGTVDITMAEAKYDASCKLNNKTACTDLAKVLVKSTNTYDKRKRGLQMLGKHCKNNDYEACSTLGVESYKAGLFDNAKHFLKDPCIKGKVATSCYNLGLAYSAGKKSDKAAAQQYYDSACKMGSTKACAKARG